MAHIGTWKGQGVWSVLLKYRGRKLYWKRMMTRKTRCLCVSGPDSAAAARPERCKGWSIGSALHMHPEHPVHRYMHPMHHYMHHTCTVCTCKATTVQCCLAPVSLLVVVLSRAAIWCQRWTRRICIWCTIHYLEMQYLVQRDKGCELRHKGSVSPMAAAVRRWANTRVHHPVATFAHVLILSAEQDWQYLYMGSDSTDA